MSIHTAYPLQTANQPILKIIQESYHRYVIADSASQFVFFNIAFAQVVPQIQADKDVIILNLIHAVFPEKSLNLF